MREKSGQGEDDDLLSFSLVIRECKCSVSTEKEEIEIIIFIRCLFVVSFFATTNLNLQQTEPNRPLNSTRDLTAQKGRLHAVQFFPYQTKDNRQYLYQRYIFT